MKRLLRLLRIDRCAVAAVEFAIIAPTMMIIFGGLGDFGLMMLAKSRLAIGVSQGAQYAMLAGPSVTGSAIQGVVSSYASAAGLTQTVTTTVNGSTNGPACYCIISGALVAASPSTLSNNSCSSSTCSDKSTPAAFVTITSQFTYIPLMPLLSAISPTKQKVNETILVKLS